MGVFADTPLWSAQEAATQVKNVFCVGRNYRDHAMELGNDVPDQPMIFGKPTHAVVPSEGIIVLPDQAQNIHHELEIVLFFGSEFADTEHWQEAVAGVALGLDLTDRDAQNALKAKGHPWEYAKGFRNSAVITDVYRVLDWHALTGATFWLEKNGEVVQSGEATDMLFDFRTLCAFIDRRFGLAAGDIVFTGTPAGVGRLQVGDQLSLTFDGRPFGELTIG